LGQAVARPVDVIPGMAWLGAEQLRCGGLDRSTFSTSQRTRCEVGIDLELLAVQAMRGELWSSHESLLTSGWV
jgi:hypothetical protein